MGWVLAVVACAGCGARSRAATDAGARSDADTDSATGTESSPPCDLDADLDGHAAAECGGDDCDDADRTVHPGAAEATWVTEVVDVTDGRHVALAIEPGGISHVAYEWSDREGDLEIRHAVHVAGEWSIEPVEAGTTNTQMRMVLAPDGLPHLGYAYRDPGDVRDTTIHHARLTGRHWEVTTIDDPDEMRDGIGMALDPINGAVHIAYSDAIVVRHVTNATGSWTVERVDTPGIPFAVSLAIDADGTIHMPFASHPLGSRWPTAFVRYARAAAGGGWQVEDVVELDEAWAEDVHPVTGAPAFLGSCCTDLAIDEAGVVHVGHLGGRLGYAARMGGVWSDEVAADLEGSDFVGNSLALASDGTVHMSYVGQVAVGEGGLSGEVGHAWGRAGDWRRETIATRTGGSDSSVAIDGEGGVHVAYVDTGGLVTYASRRTDDVDRDCDGDGVE